MKLVAVLLLAATVALLPGCGGEDSGDLAHTCTAVRRAFPATLYDDQDNAAFARRLGRILDGADPEARDAFSDLADALALVVAARGDNDAVVTANVQLLAAVDRADRACTDAGAGPVHR